MTPDKPLWDLLCPSCSAPRQKPSEYLPPGGRLIQITVLWMDEQRDLSKNQLLFSTCQQVHQRQWV
jgi:hypothetical protein